MKFPRLFALSLLVLLLAACSPAVANSPAATETIPTAEPVQTELPQAAGWPETTQVDEQGAVIVEVTPLNLNAPSDTLEFEVSLDTHSVDLSMDLAQLARLTTDSGHTVQANLWDAQVGGHHVSGRLIFPNSYDGKPFLEGATQVTLHIENVDADLRLFNWVVGR